LIPLAIISISGFSSSSCSRTGRKLVAHQEIGIGEGQPVGRAARLRRVRAMPCQARTSSSAVGEGAETDLFVHRGDPACIACSGATL
jgi:hypothetical protein